MKSQLGAVTNCDPSCGCNTALTRVTTPWSQVFPRVHDDVNKMMSSCTLCSLVSRPPMFCCSSVCIHTRSRSFTSVYYTEHKPKNKKNGVGLGMRVLVLFPPRRPAFELSGKDLEVQTKVFTFFLSLASL